MKIKTQDDESVHQIRILQSSQSMFQQPPTPTRHPADWINPGNELFVEVFVYDFRIVIANGRAKFTAENDD